jgi:riboflavin kinase / FMN adenylyltransferase
LKVFHSISEFRSNNKTAVTLGTFDGVHLGHQKIIQRLLNAGLESIALTFSQHPRSILHKGSNVKLLNTNEEKIALLDKYGIDNLIIQNFDTAFSELSGEAFVKNILVDQLNIQKIIIGYDHRFGKNRSSDIHDLIYFGKKYHFDVEQISAKEIDEISISSTKIRNAIVEGDIKLANEYLGYPYTFSGIVTQGRQLGRTIGFPTANLKITDTRKILPKNGVYVVTGYWENKWHQGMMNIGVKPTVDGHNLTIEVHFFDLDQDLYDKEISISVLGFLRAERKFDSLESLKEQLNRDESSSIHFFLNKK